ncbi:hypothetical protein B0F90DRAFT_1686735 [Multifurca ochricompacta]|uniref:Uncharacterized protein n=1 Tax=Multifurca ochricompacta TaxID=376703 RepID=A0AAD4MBC1_9AGAM|nr:hypothetical protein B0F90DRAFT_1686735 [Multifurca ochricompacta]
MPTSELTDALNPFIGQQQEQEQGQEQRQPHYSDQQHQHPYNTQTQISYTPPHQSSSFTPHRSELEYAISEPPPPPRPKVDAVHVVQELLKAFTATREAQENENKRRATWEHELETKYHQRQAETETRLAEMKREIAYLKVCVASLLHQQPEGTAQATGSRYLLGEPSSPSVAVLPGSSLEKSPSFVSRGRAVSEQLLQNHGMLIDPPSPLASPALSNSRKRPTSPFDCRESDSIDSGSESPRSSTGQRLQRRINNHDKRCYTIQTAMRRHIYRVMGVGPEDELPPSHHEGLPLSDHEPVRFVWEKTIKQSKHNALMKERILADLKASRRVYKHVPEADFTSKTVSSAFDQAFSTFRQKYKAQIDPTVLLTAKTREDLKATKSRRLHRKKLKREQRVSMRERTPAFAHATFDGAMELDCMSSEESDENSKQAVAKDKAIIVRGIPWRSNRLLKFYTVLDEDDRLNKSMKPKRGLGRRDRNEGPPKDGLAIPPKGVASWMISRRWLRNVQIAHPEVLQAMQELVYDPPGFDWTKFDAMGYETDDEHLTVDSALEHGAQFASHSPAFPNSTTSYALVDALAPTS